MNIGLTEAAAIVGKTPDELMFYHQVNRIQAGVNQESLAWEFKLQDVLELKAALDADEAEESEEDDS
jgi:hypothetical protein